MIKRERSKYEKIGKMHFLFSFLVMPNDYNHTSQRKMSWTYNLALSMEFSMNGVDWLAINNLRDQITIVQYIIKPNFRCNSQPEGNC